MGYPDWQQESALATLIAGALATAGIPVLGAPVPLYRNPQPAAPGAGIAFGTNNSSWAAMIAAGVAGMTSSIIYDPVTDGPNGIPAAWPGSGGPIGAGVTVPIVNFLPDIPTTLSGANDAALTAFATPAPNGTIFMAHHECNLLRNKLNPALVQALDNYLLAFLTGINPTFIYARGLASSPVNGGQDVTPYITPGMPLYGIDGYQHSNQSATPSTVFDKTLAAILAVQPGAQVAIIETGTALSVQDWFNAVAAYAITNGLVRVQSFFGSGGGGSQPWKASFKTAMNAVISQLGGAATTVSVPAGATHVFAPLAGSQIANYAIANGQSYDVTITAIAGAGSTKPFYTAALNWYNQDSSTAIAAFPERWTAPAGVSTSAGTIVSGKGPQAAQFLKANLTNQDTVPMAVTFSLNSVSRVTARDDWRWEAPTSVNVPGYTLAGGQAAGLALGEIDNVIINPGHAQSFLFSMFAGQAYLRVVVNGAANVKSVHVAAAPQPPSVWGVTNLLSEYLPLSAASGDNDQSFNVPLPRGPMQLTITNNDPNQITVFAEMVAVEPA